MTVKIVDKVEDDLLMYLLASGEVVDPSGGAQTVIADGLRNAFGYAANSPSRPTINAAIRALLDNGLLVREKAGRQIYSVVLTAKGKERAEGLAEGPAKSLPNAHSNDSSPAPSERRGIPLHRRSGKSLDRVLSEIQKLPLPEKLMIAGMIVDGCAGEVDETYSRLRSVLGKI